MEKGVERAARPPSGGRVHRSGSMRGGLATALPPLVFLVACGGPSGPRQEIPTSCAPRITVSLEVAEAAEYSKLAARFFCVEAVGDDAEYVVAAFAATDESLSFEVVAENTIGTSGPPSPLIVPRLAGERAATDLDLILPDAAFDARLREIERRELTLLVPTGADRGPSPALLARSVTNPTVGEEFEFNANSQEACSNALTITARVEAISDRTVVMADLANPSGGFQTADYELYAETFDDVLFPIAEANFGTPGDIDGNGRIIVLFTQEVNRRTPPGASSFVAGFFFSRDLFPTTASGNLSACAASNESELLYLMVPDPNGVVNGNPTFKLEFVRQYTLATILHEYQHLVNAHGRLHSGGSVPSNWNEETWLNEGLSHIAEELLFYGESQLTPGQNLVAADIQSGGPTVVQAFNNHQLFNLSRLREHLEAASTSGSFSPNDDLAARGATWSFLRYAADRRGGNQATFFHDLVNSSTRGLDNLADVIGSEATVFEWMTDWAVALYADDRVEGVQVRHLDASWNHPNLQAQLFGPGSYPLETLSLSPGLPLDETLGAGGGTAYLRFGVGAGTVGQIEITTGGKIPPEELRVVLLRTN